MKAIRRMKFFRMDLFHPLPLFVYMAGLITMNLLFTHPVFHGTVCLFTFILTLVFVGRHKSRRLIRYGLVIAAAVFILNVLFNNRGSHILLYFLGNPVTLEAIAYGIYAMFLMITMIGGFLLFNRFVDRARFLYLFSNVSPKIALILHMALRYVEVFSDKAREFIEIQRLRTQASLSGQKDNSLKENTRRSAELLTAFISLNLEESMETAVVLKAKGYGLNKRSSYEYYRFKREDGLFLIVSVFLVGILIAARLTGIGVYEIYPRLVLPEMTPVNWFFAGLLALFAGAPLLIEFYAHRGEV